MEIIGEYAHLIVSTKIFNQIPLKYCRESIDLAFISAFYCYFNFEYERGNEIVSNIQDKLDEDSWRCMKIYKFITQEGYIDIGEEDISIEIVDNMNLLTKIVYYTIAAFGYRFIGNYAKSLEIVEYIEKVNEQLKNSYVSIFCIYNRTAILEDMGRLKESEEGYIKLKSITDDRKYTVYFSVFADIGLPGVYIKKMLINEAESLLIKAENDAKKFREKDLFITLNRGVKYNVAEVKCLQGKFQEAEEILSNLIKDDKENVAYLSMFALKIRLLSVEDRIKDDEYIDFINKCEISYKKKF